MENTCTTGAVGKKNEVDAAWTYLNGSSSVSEGATGVVNMLALRRKIDWHIVPLMFGCYTMQFLDKVILNYAGVMGIQKDLNLKGNDFSNIATFLFVGLICFEVPNGICSFEARDIMMLTRASIPSPENPCGEVAGAQCHSLGHGRRMRCCCS